MFFLEFGILVIKKDGISCKKFQNYARNTHTYTHTYNDNAHITHIKQTQRKTHKATHDTHTHTHTNQQIVSVYTYKQHQGTKHKRTKH